MMKNLNARQPFTDKHVRVLRCALADHPSVPYISHQEHRFIWLGLHRYRATPQEHEPPQMT